MPVAHCRVELFGTLSGGAESWSAGFSTAPLIAGGQNALGVANDALTAFINQFWTAPSIQSIIPNTTALVGAKCRVYSSDGTMVESSQAVSGTPSAGTGTTALPPQCAVVVSLTTSLATARGRGRMYLPGPTAGALGTNGRLTTVNRDSYVTRMVNFLNTFNALTNTPNVVISSAVGSFNSVVSGVRVGDVIDTQRRRRDALPESYGTGIVS